jgi:uncharacterized protein involved in exopolysaccharide biosynthesis
VQGSLRSDFVAIEYYDQDPKVAAEIANAVAESYKTQHIKVASEQKRQSLDIIHDQIADQEAQRRSAQERELEAKKKAGIVGDWIVGGGSTLQAGAEIRGDKEQTFMSREQMLLQYEREVREYESEQDLISKLSPDEIIARASSLKLENPSFTSNVAKYQDAVVQRDGFMSNGLGRKHPMVVGLEKQIETLRPFIMDAAKDHVAGRDGRLSAAKKTRV